MCGGNLNLVNRNSGGEFHINMRLFNAGLHMIFATGYNYILN